MNFLVEDLVNLPKVRVRSVVREGEAIFLQLGFRDEEVPCTHCGQKTDELNQIRTVRVRDLPISGQLVYLQVPRRQFYCKNCQQYFTEELDFIEAGQKFTKRYEDYIYQRVMTSTVEQVKREEDLSWHQVNRLHQRVYERKKKEIGDESKGWVWTKSPNIKVTKTL